MVLRRPFHIPHVRMSLNLTKLQGLLLAVSSGLRESCFLSWSGPETRAHVPWPPRSTLPLFPFISAAYVLSICMRWRVLWAYEEEMMIAVSVPSFPANSNRDSYIVEACWSLLLCVCVQNLVSDKRKTSPRCSPPCFNTKILVFIFVQGRKDTCTKMSLNVKHVSRLFLDLNHFCKPYNDVSIEACSGGKRDRSTSSTRD